MLSKCFYLVILLGLIKTLSGIKNIAKCGSNKKLIPRKTELMSKNKEKNLDNYYVDDVIKEEIEIENPLKQDNNTIENKKSKDLIIDINTPIKIFHQKSKSGNCFKGLISNSPKISKKKILSKKQKKNK